MMGYYGLTREVLRPIADRILPLAFSIRDILLIAEKRDVLV